MRIISTIILSLFLATSASANLPNGYPTQCDINGDGRFSFVADYGNFIQAFRGEATNPVVVRASDMNHDGVVSTQDFGILIEECPQVSE